MTLQELQNAFSNDRLAKYVAAHNGDEQRATTHYQCNILISEAAYPVISTMEVTLRNAVNHELARYFGAADWYTHLANTPGLTDLTSDITRAQRLIASRNEIITPSKVVAELSLGFWVRLFNAEFERILWKDLRLVFRHMPKEQRQRKHVSAPLNRFRTFRNRIFHNEPICWSFNQLDQIHSEIIQLMGWINPNLLGWLRPIDRFPQVLAEVKKTLGH